MCASYTNNGINYENLFLFTLINFLFLFYCKTILDIKLWNVNLTNDKVGNDVMSLLLLTLVMFSQHLTQSTKHKRRYIFSRGIPKKLRSSGDEPSIRGKWVHRRTCSWTVNMSIYLFIYVCPMLFLQSLCHNKAQRQKTRIPILIPK